MGIQTSHWVAWVLPLLSRNFKSGMDHTEIRKKRTVLSLPPKLRES